MLYKQTLKINKISKINVKKLVNKEKEYLRNLAYNLKGKLDDFNKVIRDFEISMPKLET
ncbi:MAG: hypothetical protein K2L15_01530 [Eubacteriales bacterium]|nr:hypothetical protein [Eubacteriales bacterium]